MSARIFLCICFAALISMGGGGWAAAADDVAAGEVVKVANPKQDSSGDNVRPAISREKALDIARSLFPDILEGKDLQAELEEYMKPGQRNWLLTWNSKEPGPFGPPEHIFIMLNSKTGDLLNAGFSLGAQKPGNDVSLVSRGEALQKAEEFVKKIRPEEFARTRLDEDRSSVYYGAPGVMKQSYDFYWQRYENGIRVEGDGIGAGVSVLIGQVQYYSLSWHRGVEFPAPGPMVDAGALAGRVLDDPGLYLGYAVRVGTAAGTGGLPEAFLIYQHNAITSFFDSQTGEPLDGSGNKVPAGEARKFTGLPEPEFGAAGADPTGALKEKVSAEEAQKAAEEFFRKIGSGGEVVRSGSGNSGYGVFNDEFWSFSLREDREGGSSPPHGERQVMVDTSTGEASQYYNYDFSAAMSAVPAGGKPALTREQALDKAREFAGLVDPGRLSYTVLYKEMTLTLSNPKLPNEYNFLFTRLVNGLPFWRDGIEVSVDAASGEIRSYSRNWHRAYFPDPAGALKVEEAKKLFMQKSLMELVYFFPQDRENESAAPVLAYRFAGPTGEKGLDAVSGRLVSIDWMAARPVTPEEPELLQQHWAYLPLRLLDESDLLPNGKGFNPDGAVTRRDAVRVLIAAANRYYGVGSEGNPAFSDIGRDDRDFQALQTAVRLGVLTGGGKFMPDEPLTRETVAVWLVRALGHEEVAEMPSGIELPVKDADLMEATLRNHVAIACGLGLMTGDETGFFRPQDNLTWAELAALATKAAPRLAGRFSHW